MAKVPKISIAWVGCTNVTDDRQTNDRQTDGRAIAYCERERELLRMRVSLWVNPLAKILAKVMPTWRGNEERCAS